MRIKYTLCTREKHIRQTGYKLALILWDLGGCLKHFTAVILFLMAFDPKIYMMWKRWKIDSILIKRLNSSALCD